MKFDQIIGEVVPDLADLGLMAGTLPSRPPGDPSALLAAAASWTALATGLRDVIGSTDADVARLAGQWQGPAKDAFTREWSTLVTEVDHACDQLSSVGGQLDQAAEVLERAQREWLVAMWATIATTAAGVALTFVPLGEVEAGAVASEAAEGFALARGLSRAAAALIKEAVRIAVEVAEAIVAKFVILFSVNLGVQAGVSAIEYHTLSYVDLREAAGQAISGTEPDGFPLRSTTGKTVGTAVLTAGLEVGGEAAQNGQVDPMTVLFTGLKGASGPVSEQLSKTIREWLAKRRLAA